MAAAPGRHSVRPGRRLAGRSAITTRNGRRPEAEGQTGESTTAASKASRTDPCALGYGRLYIIRPSCSLWIVRRRADNSVPVDEDLGWGNRRRCGQKNRRQHFCQARKPPNCISVHSTPAKLPTGHIFTTPVLELCKTDLCSKRTCVTNGLVCC